MMAFAIGHLKGNISDATYKDLITELVAIPGKIEKALEVNGKALALAKVLENTHNALYLGRGYLFPVAPWFLLKEISYIHEGTLGAEMKHTVA
jgi:glucosamine--fructose-6-phosphate aminotransferase (isomerizing)